MNFRTTIILALIFIIGIGGVLLLKKQDAKKEEEKKSEGKLLTIEKDKITDIYLEPSGIHAVKDSVRWSIVAPVKTDGEKSSLDAILSMFDWGKAERIVSSDPNEYASFGLKPERGKLVLVHSAGADTFYLGDKSPTGSYVFARKSGSPDVFLVTTSLESNIQKTLFDLREKNIIGFETGQANSLELVTPKGEFSLTKEGTNWELKAPLACKADESKVSQILSRLSSERAKEFVEEEPKSLTGYGMDKPTYEVNLTLGENRAKKTLLIGKPTEGKYFAKDESRTPVFTVDSSFVSQLKVTLKDLRDKKVTDISSYDIDRLVLEQPTGTISCEKDTAGNWMITAPKTGKALAWKVSGITTAVANLKADDFAGNGSASLRTFGLDKPSATGKFYKKDALLVELLAGKEAKDDKRYVKTADDNTVYIVGKDIYDKLTTKLEDLLEPPPQTETKPAEGAKASSE